jgi:hypothetical protein
VVIPALALPTKLAAIAYCSMFVVGTVTAMGGYTLLIGAPPPARPAACALAGAVERPGPAARSCCCCRYRPAPQLPRPHSWGLPTTPARPPPTRPPAGTTSAALTKERPWLQAHLSTIASGVAVLVGIAILASGFGMNLPFLG